MASLFETVDNTRQKMGTLKNGIKNGVIERGALWERCHWWEGGHCTY